MVEKNFCKLQKKDAGSVLTEFFWYLTEKKNHRKRMSKLL
jgi:hypothetical protein